MTMNTSKMNNNSKKRFAKTLSRHVKRSPPYKYNRKWTCSCGRNKISQPTRGPIDSLEESMLKFTLNNDDDININSSNANANLSGSIDEATNNSTGEVVVQLKSINDHGENDIKTILNHQNAQASLQPGCETYTEYSVNKSITELEPIPIQLQNNELQPLLTYPPGEEGITINVDDYLCLATGQYLNDIIIDFYLKWLHNNLIPDDQKDRTFIFSTFFYTILTTMKHRRNADKDIKQTIAEMRHERVENFTKNVNLFDKDFIIIPINEQYHWLLAIICYIGLKTPVTFDTNQPTKKSISTLPSQIGNDNEFYKRKKVRNNSMFNDCPSGYSNTFKQYAERVKQPVILIFDSLASMSRRHIFRILRDYLNCEYKVKNPNDPFHTFNRYNLPGHIVKVPQQNNTTDCGLYLLQYVEQFFTDPLRDYRIPIKQLKKWFDILTVTRKREDISNLIKRLMDEYNGSDNKIYLPDIPFPTLNGQFVKRK